MTAAKPHPGRSQAEALAVSLGAYEGPLDVLLELARAQKVDLAAISILALAEQYLAFIADARRLSLELAADYLVMAAWLAFLKSRLLLPPDPGDAGPSASDMAERLQRQLRRLAEIRRVAPRLVARDRLGWDVFVRGAPEPIRLVRHTKVSCTLHALLTAYGGLSLRRHPADYAPRPPAVMSLEAALERLKRLLGLSMDWLALLEFLPVARDEAERRSALASTFLAALELARVGAADLRQGEPFGPLYLRRSPSA